MEEITVIGLDLAKSIFQVHGIAADSRVIIRKTLRRAQLLPFFAKLPSCLIGMEACSSAHYWAREFQALGHQVRLMPPVYVKPYVKRNKTDAGDAEAICEAVTRPNMRFVTVKSEDQQAALCIHRVRDLLIRQRTQVVNVMRGLCAEFGIEIRQGLAHAMALKEKLLTGEITDLPPTAARVMASLARQIEALQQQIVTLDTELAAWHKQSDVARRLATMPGIGPVAATALAATVTDPQHFKSGRQFAAWLGLTPLARSSGGKERLGRISRMGDTYLRRLLVNGVANMIRWARIRPEKSDPWLVQLLARKPARLVMVALANKSARIAWAIMSRAGEIYHTRTKVGFVKEENAMFVTA